jgi:hypothetical protein
MNYIKSYENFNNVEFNIGDKIKLKESSHSLNSDDKNSFWYNQYGVILDHENIEIEGYGKLSMYLIHLESDLNQEIKDFAKNSMVITKNDKLTPNHNNKDEEYDFWVSPNYLTKY